MSLWAHGQCNNPHMSTQAAGVYMSTHGRGGGSAGARLKAPCKPVTLLMMMTTNTATWLMQQLCRLVCRAMMR